MFEKLDLDPILRDLARFSTRSVLESVGALQLIPVNAEHLLRLNLLAEIASNQLSASDADVPLSDLNGMCNDGAIGTGVVPAMEDPPGGMFTEAFVYRGGTYVMLRSLAEEATYVAQVLARALFLHPEEFGHPEYLAWAQRLLEAVLKISREMTLKAQLRRGAEPSSDPDRRVLVPNGDLLAELRKAVVFGQDDLASLFIETEDFEDIVSGIGDGQPKEVDLYAERLAQRPIVLLGEQYIVAQPSNLLVAWRHAVLQRAALHGLETRLAGRLRDVVWSDVQTSLDFLGWDLRQVADSHPGAPPNFLEAVAPVDRDKAVYISLVTDDLEGYAQPFGEWDVEQYVSFIEQRLSEVERGLLTVENGPNDVVHLVLFQSFGRVHQPSLEYIPPGEGSPRLLLSATDLRTMAEIEGGHELALWKYAHAHQRARMSMHIIGMSALDEFHLYRSSEYSYHLSDTQNPDAVVLPPEGDGLLRREVYRERDWHGVPSYQPRRVLEVTRLYGDPRIPLYVPLRQSGEAISIVVETDSLPVWIVADPIQSSISKLLHQTLALLCEAFAYWIWQSSVAIAPVLAGLSDIFDKLVLRIELIEPTQWEAERRGTSGEGNSQDYQLSVDAETGQIAWRLAAGVMEAMSTADNAGERMLLLETLKALFSMAEQHGVDADDLVGSSADGVVEHVAPLGPKKIMVMLEPSREPRLDNRYLPRRRRLQKHDTSQALDRIGDFLRATQPAREVAERAEIVEVLNSVVGFLFQEIRRLAITLERNTPLLVAISQHEAIVQNVAERRLTIPTRMACYPDFDLTRQLLDEIPEASRWALSSRFVVEYLASNTTDGIRPMTMALYDSLLALSSQLISWANLSDLVNYKIGDVRLIIHPTGRLEGRGDTLLSAHAAFKEEVAGEHFKGAVASFGSHWDTNSTKEPDSFATQLEEATRAEFGRSALEVSFLYAELMNIGDLQRTSVKSLPMAELVRELAERLEWGDQDVLGVLRQLVLTPRTNFLAPDAPFAKHDVWPWRFNRELSYLRRPVVIAPSGEAWWGNVHIAEAMVNLQGLCIEGRLDARSDEMKAFKAKANRLIGMEFNNRVADAAQSAGLTAKKRLKKLAGVPIGSPGASLGDIDVLAADAAGRRLLVVECKDLAMARTPYEYGHELNSLFVSRGNRPSIVDQQRAIANWVEANTNLALQELGIETGGHWRTMPRASKMLN